MSNTTQDTITSTAESISEHISEGAGTSTDITAEHSADAAKEIGDQLDLSGYNLNAIRPQVFKTLSYWQKWSLRRQAGIFFYTASYAIYTFVAYVALKMFYLVYAKDFHFTLDWWSVPLALGAGLTFWFIHEAIYKAKLSAASKK